MPTNVFSASTDVTSFLLLCAVIHVVILVFLLVGIPFHKTKMPFC